ncbi:hypothetical protein P5F43_15170 [Clostridium perfringens]|uniref:hypothetical protein n=1 Tax=Clostridium TaxID=1485 RepID=UPI0018E46410|nr:MULTISPECIES: hypothetical protein [Clostridium]ELC8368288.1 hypothetical protein [Clostridium perfringens]MBI6111843.1 hypothetical protein [Clostridium perfringens]MBI6114898.1 hypothetical protein [Clostridium perfringens]MCX0367960.1 hypothetical protein [Clostridium perfringens]MCX0403529.1 hypothetical protein [Clostridium perfringens]
MNTVLFVVIGILSISLYFSLKRNKYLKVRLNAERQLREKPDEKINQYEIHTFKA